VLAGTRPVLGTTTNPERSRTRLFEANDAADVGCRMATEPKRKPQQDDRDRKERERVNREEALDEALKNTFPASDSSIGRAAVSSSRCALRSEIDQLLTPPLLGDIGPFGAYLRDQIINVAGRAGAGIRTPPPPPAATGQSNQRRRRKRDPTLESATAPRKLL
jgi:hypothetical protein